MGQFIFRRTLYAVATLFILSLTIFTVVRLTGDPVTLMAEPGAQEADHRRRPGYSSACPVGPPAR